MIGIGTPAPARRLLDDGRQTRAMRWIMAIMIFLTVLAAALGLGATQAAGSLDAELAGRLTVQIVEADAAVRDRDVARIVATLKSQREVTRVQEVSRQHLAELLKPWLGDAGLDPDLPMPAMIDVDLANSSDAALAEVARIVHAIAPEAQIDRHAKWLSPVRGFIAMLGWVAIGIVLLMVSATTAVVLLAARSGLDAHRPTIDVLHMLGSTDVQVARLFQRRIALETLLGGIVGLVCALLLVWFLQGQLALLGAQTLSGMALTDGDWLLLIAVPFLFALLAMVAARIAILRTMRRTL